jgi:hypothetical protein
MCFVFIWEQTATCATYSINWLVFITEMESVYSAVGTGPLNEAVCASSVKGQYRYMYWIKLQCKSAQIFRNSRSHLQVPGTRRVTWCKFRTEDPQILGATVQNVVATVSLRPGFVHPCWSSWVRITTKHRALMVSAFAFFSGFCGIRIWGRSLAVWV